LAALLALRRRAGDFAVLGLLSLRGKLPLPLVQECEQLAAVTYV
jgi:hypothetical protein